MSVRPLFKATDEELIRKIHGVENFDALADLFELNVHGLKRMLSEIFYKEKHYKEFFIKKRSGGERQILAPDPKLKLIQRRIAYVLSLLYLGRSSVHGFRRGKNIITNAEKHVRRKVLLNIDLENFFPTIHFGRIRGILQARPYSLSKKTAAIIAGFCCYKRKLPQGAPTSPIISNIICSKLDHDLQQLAYNEHCTYSRYADDIVFSTNTRNRFSQNMLEGGASEWKAGLKLNDIIVENGFIINHQKTRVRFYTERQEVTGLIVNKFPNIKREFVREIRMMLHIWKKFGLEAANEKHMNSCGKNFYHSLSGKINFLKLVRTKENNTYNILAKKFNSLAKKPIFEIVKVKNWPEGEHFPAGAPYSGTVFIQTLFSLAEKEIFILDNYLTGKIIGFLEKRLNENPLISIKLLISEKNVKKYRECVDELKKLMNMHPKMQIDCRKHLVNKAGKIKAHDRYLVLDSKVYHFGHSLSELGITSSSVDKMSELAKKEALNDLKFQFDTAKIINLST